MSIFISDALPVQVTTTSPTQTPAMGASSPSHGNAEIIFFWICVAWALLGLLAAKGLRAFSRQSIVGPIRTESLDDAGYLFFAGIFGYSLAMLIGVSIARKLSLPEELKQQVLQVLVFSLLTFSIVCILQVTQPKALHRLGLSPKWIVGGAIGGAATLFIVYPFIQIVGQLVVLVEEQLHGPPPQTHELLIFLQKSVSPWWRVLGICSAVIVAPITEELLFRGLIQTSLGRFFSWLSSTFKPVSIEQTSPQVSAASRWTAVLVTAAIFAAIHNSVPFFPPLFVLAVALGYIYERTGNLWVTIFAHGLFNSGQILFFLSSAK